jgi:NifU-like protein
MAIYPDRVVKILAGSRLSRACGEASSSGVSAAFECGGSARFWVSIQSATKTLENVDYAANGCGFMIAAAEVIARVARGRKLTELHGTSGLEATVMEQIGPIPDERNHCLQVSAAAFRNALAEYRSRTAEEFQGEKALICTCFGITEETVLAVIEETDASDPSEVSAACNAGSGCGSCRMLIQEMIDARSASLASGIVL